MSAREETCWQPSAAIATLRERGRLLSRLRQFLERRDYWEVETPILSRFTTVDAHLDPCTADIGTGQRRYLQTSPELAMKRLLAAGSGSIFQITRGFRAGECGPLHNPEFTIVEWYRVGGTYHALMGEIDEMLQEVFALPAADRWTYRDAFRHFAAIDPFEASTSALCERCSDQGWCRPTDDRDELLNLLLVHCVEPGLGRTQPSFLLDYPASQAALARLRGSTPPVAERFELYVDGIEWCNGFQELTDADELIHRFQRQNEIRRGHGKTPLPVDSPLITAMRAGLPESAGVALGFDRAVLHTTGGNSLDEVIAFPSSLC